MTPVNESDFFDLDINYITHFRVNHTIFIDINNILNFYIVSCSNKNVLTDDIQSFLQRTNLSLQDFENKHNEFINGEFSTNKLYSDLKVSITSDDIITRELDDLSRSMSKIKQSGFVKNTLDPLYIERLDYNGKRILLASTHSTDILACLLLGVPKIPVVLV
jgi:hypothetical protein